MKRLFVLALAVAMVFAFTAPLMAAEWNFYGNTRFQTFSADRDSDLTGTGESDADTQWYMQSNSRIGGKVAAGDVAGHFEFAVDGQASGNVGTRHLTGSWNFGAGTLLVGHTWTLTANLLSNQAANGGQGLLGYGSVYTGRKDQIRLTFGGLKIALLAPSASAAFVGGDVDTTLPKIEIAYRFATDMFWVEPVIGYNTFDRQYGATNATTDVTSMLYGFKGKVNFGPAYVGASLMLGTNPTEYGASGTGMTATLVGTEYKDVDYMEYMANVGFKMNDMVTFEAGYGAQQTETEPAAVKVEQDRFAYYIQADISLAPGVHLIPEYSLIDNGETKVPGLTVDNGSTTYIGAKWQINF